MSANGKKLINLPENSVDECLQGFVAVNPGLCLLENHRVVLRADFEEVKAAGKVTLVSGGGSGHEPAHAGYVGAGMLTAAVAGAVFTSPPPTSILAAIRLLASGSKVGTLLIVKNYTGDRLNFGLAAERAKAEGLVVDMVVIGEDSALTSADKTAGRRGLAGTVLIHKIAGAMAEDGRSLQEIVSFLRETAQSMATIGLSLSPCSVPGSGPSFTLNEDEVELGLGIHGEAGVKRLKLMPAGEAVAAMLDHMTNQDSSTCLELKQGQQVALLVNNLGGTSALELNIVAKEAISWLEHRGLDVEKVFCGSFMSSLEMAGVSLTVLHLNGPRRLCLDAVTSAPAWCVPLLPRNMVVRVTPQVVSGMDGRGQQVLPSSSQAARVATETARMLHKAITYVCQALGNCYIQLNSLDTESGDGDCGTTLKRGTDAVLGELGDEAAPWLPCDCPRDLFIRLAAIVEDSMGGSSGAMYSIMLTAAAGALSRDTSPSAWCAALDEGIQAVMRYGGAKPGDRTMLDALVPAQQALQKGLATKTAVEAFAAATEAAERGAQTTAGMVARAGRASYVSADRLLHPDPGAHAVGIWMRAAYQACKLV